MKHIVIKLKITAIDIELGTKYCRDGFGSAPIKDNSDSAYEKAIIDACKNLGIAPVKDAEFLMRERE